MDHFLARASSVGYQITEDCAEIEAMSLHDIFKEPNDYSQDIPSPNHSGMRENDNNDFKKLFKLDWE